MRCLLFFFLARPLCIAASSTNTIKAVETTSMARPSKRRKAKWYTREHYDYSLEGLRRAVPKALAAVGKGQFVYFSTVLCVFLRPIEMVFSMVVKSLRIVYIRLTVE